MSEENSDNVKRRRSALQPERPAVDYAVLGLLQQGPSHGYDLTRQFSPSEELGQVCHLEMSMLYAILKKLEREGLISGQEEPVSEHKSRRLVQLTDRGRAEFEEWLSQPVSHTREIRLDFMVKLYFARQSNKTLALSLLDEQLKYNQNWLANLESHATNNQFESWVQNFRRLQNTAVIEWLQNCRAQLQTRQNNDLNTLQEKA